MGSTISDPAVSDSMELGQRNRGVDFSPPRSRHGIGFPAFAVIVLVVAALVGSLSIVPTLVTPSSGTSSTTEGSLQLQNPPPFANPVYLIPSSSGAGGCSVTVNGTLSGAPCFGSNISDAVVFDCAGAAGTQQGCTTTVVSPGDAVYDYNLTLWYPYSSPGLTGVNCRYLPSIGYSSPLDAWCVTTGPNAFIVSQAGAGPMHE